MLDRIEEVQGVGLLYSANGKPFSCLKTTLIYADNGRGKSTLATVLRSASTGNAALIAQRRTVDGTLPPKATLQFSNGHKVNFSGTAWSERRPEVLVFDADFVERNVHSGGAVSTDHRKNLLEFALGEAAVAARAAVDKATSDAKLASEKVQALTGQLSGHHVGLSLAQFAKLPKVPDADVQIATLKKRVSAASNAAAIAAKPTPVLAAEPALDLDWLFTILGSTLENVHADAEETVKQHLTKLGNNTAEGWLSQGQQFGSSETCPYCAQSTVGNHLIQAYQTHFNAAYAALKKNVASLTDTVISGTAQTIADTFSSGVALARAQAAAWHDHVQTQAFHFEDAPVREALAALQETLVDLVKRKQAAPAESHGTPLERAKADGLWESILTPMRVANGQIKAAAALITTCKSQLATDKVADLQLQIAQLEASKRRHDAVAVDLLAKYEAAVKDKEAAESAKKSERDKLDALMTATLQKYEKSINELLKNFGAAFRIKGMGANFRGGAPRTEYGLLLRGKDVTLEGGPPSFSTTMSEGDKRTLAFAFFIASTLADPKLATRIVVVDDPMCSLDLNRRHHTRSVLKKIHSNAEQLIVLAHDPYFIRDLRDMLKKDNSATPIALFQLAPAAGDYTTFAQFDVDKECESAYSQHHRLLNEFVTAATGDAKAVAKAIRPMLEGYLHRRFPGLLPKSLTFGQVVVLVRDALPTSPLRHAKNLVAELNEINDYAGQFHHDTNPDADTMAIVSSELKTFVERALALVHGAAPPP